MTTKLDPKHKELWLKALRSGEYKQCKGALTDGVGYCCLGVAEAVGLARRAAPELGKGSLLSNAFLDLDLQGTLVTLNDNGTPFAEIADLIEKSL